MALTKTRTRTQTALTELARVVADVHGELEFLEGLLTELGGIGQGVTPEMRAKALARQVKLMVDRNALYATVRQFDPEIDPGQIGAGDGWRGRFGSKRLGAKSLVAKYFRAS